MSTAASEQRNGLEIAIVGMAGRFPGAEDIDAFWENLKAGVESVVFSSDQASESADQALHDPRYVRSGGALDGVELFDAAFFGLSPREAETMDPQQRIFLECAWHALEHAGYDSEAYAGLIGVYAGLNMNTYLFNFYTSYTPTGSVDELQMLLGNDKDYLTTRISYKLNLGGPSVGVQTACSTSLVAVHLACRGLLSGDCDMALAGGISVIVPQKVGYVYQEGGLHSPDGHCRAFDARAQGTVFSNGVGIVVLKRLADALADGDTIYALIKGSAINNDGALKVGYTAPGQSGQEKVVRAAQTIAEVAPETITYVEAHGTGTPLGDPIEIAALTRVFRSSTAQKGFCAIGSVKTNIGHLNTAAGIAGLIKTTLALKHGLLPPSLHFEQPNPQIDFANSPFYVNTQLREWRTSYGPRRAGVSSFGVGGTNAHIVLEEAPAARASSTARPWQLLPLSAKSSAALEQMTANLHAHLRADAGINLADVAYTLQAGRRPFSHRRILLCQDRAGALSALETLDPQRVFTAQQEPVERSVVFMFPGGGAQYVQMGRELYQTELVFREQVDLCAELLQPYLEYDLREMLYFDERPTTNDHGDTETRRPGDKQTGRPGDRESRNETNTQSSVLSPQSSFPITRTSVALPALFVVEYALAQLWMSWGVRPSALIGHSLGEYTAACLSGVLTLEDALALVVVRGRLFEELPRGAMLSVPLPEAEARVLLGDRLSLAAINGPAQCVVSGPEEAIAELAARLAEKQVEARRIQIDVAAHSQLVEPILEQFARFVEQLRLGEPRIPYISNVSGTWITPAETTDPRYWVRHLRQTVRFGDGVAELLREPARVLLEVGPGHTLCTLAKLQTESAGAQAPLPSIRHPYDRQPDTAFLLATAGRLWLLGVKVDWAALHSGELRRRLPLPLYPFERQRYWIDRAESGGERAPVAGKKRDIADWFAIPSWKRSLPPPPFQATNDTRRWLIFADPSGLGAQTLDRLRAAGQEVVSVSAGTQFDQDGADHYRIDPRARDDYGRLLAALDDAGQLPDLIVHFWSIAPLDQAAAGSERFQKAQDRGFYSLLFLAQALAERGWDAPLRIWVVSNGTQPVESGDVIAPERATILALCKVIPQEYEQITCRHVDVVLAGQATRRQERLIDQLLAEIGADSADLAVAYRGVQRWVQTFEAARLAGDVAPVKPLRERGVYLITGGLGRVGLLLAEYLARTVRARLILTGRSTFPARSAWPAWLTAHDDADRTSRAIRKVQALEQLGAEVLLVSADAADEPAMRAVLRQADERFGALHGVIHPAGIAGRESFQLIPETDRSVCEAQFQPKVHGVYVLETLLSDRELDFCVLVSSNAAVLGGLGAAGYAAANLFMDTFAAAANGASETRWISANWDGWLLDADSPAATATQTSMDQYAMTPSESVEAFRRVVTSAVAGQVIVSTGDLTRRLNLWLRRAPREQSEVGGDATPFHPRPALRTDYALPSNEIEQHIVAIWQEMLGIEQVGVHDNFFELGGNSLLASRVVARMRDTFQVDFPLRSFFETLTVAEMAQTIAQLAAEDEDDEEMRMLQLVEQLLDDEVDEELIKRIELLKTRD